MIFAFWFWFAIIDPKFIYKIHLFLIYQVHRKGSSFIASFMEHPVCGNFKIFSAMILNFYHDFLQSIQNACVKVNLSQNFRCSARPIKQFVDRTCFVSVLNDVNQIWIIVLNKVIFVFDFYIIGKNTSCRLFWYTLLVFYWIISWKKSII